MNTVLYKTACRITSMVLLWFISIPSYSQTTPCPPNINFETGTFSNWQLFTGTCCPITMTGTGLTAGRHAITSGTGLDTFGLFPVVSPGGGLFSAKIGNSQTGAQAERVRYYINVPPGSGRYILVYRYAVVFEDPKHSIAQQPRFEVKAYDSATNAAISCAQFSYVSQSSLPGFYPSTIRPSTYCKAWTTATLDLTGRGGTTVAIDFSSGDCAAGGHFGYGYVDMNCGLFQVYALKCNGSSNITLKAPNGYAKYKWMDSLLTTVIDTFQNITIPAPSTPKTYAVILTPYTGYGCPDTLYTTYVIANTVATAMSDTTICLGEGPITLTGTGSTNDTPLTYSWAPIAGLSCFNCQSTVTKPKATTKYLFTATSNAGCAYVDTLNVTVDTVVLADIFVTDDSLCMPAEIDIKNNFNNPITATYTWDLDSAIVMGASTRDSMHAKWLSGGVKRLILNVVSGTCNSTDTVIVRQGYPVTATPLTDMTLCPGKSVQLFTNPTSIEPVFSKWTPATRLSCTTCHNPIATPITPTTYYYFASTAMGCSYKDTITIKMDSTVVYANVTADKDTVCPYEPVRVKNTLIGTPKFTTYNWFLDSAVATLTARDSLTIHWRTPGRKKVRVDLPSNYCVVKDSLYVYVTTPYHVTAPSPVHICLGDSASITASSNYTGTPMYWWFPSSYLNCSTCPTVTSRSQVNIDYKVTLSNESVCSDTAIVKVMIDTTNASIKLPKDTVCQNEVVTLLNTGITSATIIHRWDADSATIINDDKKGKVDLKWSKPGKKKIVLTTDGSACDGSDTSSLYVRPVLYPRFKISDTGCFGQPVTMIPDTTDGLYLWEGDDQKPIQKDYKPNTFTWTSTGVKKVILTLTDKFKCDSLSDTATVTIHESPSIRMNVIADARICDGDYIRFSVDADGSYSYKWVPANVFEIASGPSAAMTVPGNITVSVEAKNEWGCARSAGFVINTDKCCSAFMPDAFTPNGDGKNDTYHPIGIDKLKIEKYMIVNRWGQILFQGNSPLDAWDGTFKGQKQDPGTYYYYIKHSCGNKEPVETKGNFILMR